MSLFKINYNYKLKILFTPQHAKKNKWNSKRKNGEAYTVILKPL